MVKKLLARLAKGKGRTPAPEAENEFAKLERGMKAVKARNAASDEPAGPVPPGAPPDRVLPGLGAAASSEALAPAAAGFPEYLHAQDEYLLDEDIENLLDEINSHVLAFIPKAIARANRIVPARYDNHRGVLAVITDRRPSIPEKQTILFALSRPEIDDLAFKVVDTEIFDRLRLRCYPPTEEEQAGARRGGAGDTARRYGLARGMRTPDRRLEEKEQGAIIDLCDKIVARSFREGASDIHFDVEEDGDTHVRMTIDGRNYPFDKPFKGAKACEQLLTVFKSFCKLPQTKFFEPRGGSYTASAKDEDGNPVPLILRCEFVPAVYGEALAIRIQLATRSPLDIDSLGADPRTKVEFEQIPSRPEGLCIWVGRVGQGKTSSMRAVAELDARNSAKWFSIQDPVEFVMQGMRTIPVVDENGKTTADKALKSVLRGGREKGIVAEIRDQQMAQLALRAASTGHLILTTLHSSDTVEAFHRLEHVGFTRSDIATSVQNIFAQVLLPKLCDRCKIPMQYGVDYKEDDLTLAGFTADAAFDAQLFRPNPSGCLACRDGYRGRVPVFETFKMTPLVREILFAMKPTWLRDVRAASIREGLIPLRWGALQQVAAGAVFIKDATTLTNWNPVDGPVAAATRRMVEEFTAVVDATYKRFDDEIRATALAAADHRQIGAAGQLFLPEGDGQVEPPPECPTGFIFDLDEAPDVPAGDAALEDDDDEAEAPASVSPFIGKPAKSEE